MTDRRLTALRETAALRRAQRAGALIELALARAAEAEAEAVRGDRMAAADAALAVWSDGLAGSFDPQRLAALADAAMRRQAIAEDAFAALAERAADGRAAMNRWTDAAADLRCADRMRDHAERRQARRRDEAALDAATDRMMARWGRG